MTAAEQTADDNLCLHISDGHKWSLIAATLTKRMLQIPDIKPTDRLALLERLNGLTDDWFTADMLATIEPMCDTGYAIYEQARTLDPADDKICNASFTVLATPKVFEHFLELIHQSWPRSNNTRQAGAIYRSRAPMKCRLRHVRRPSWALLNSHICSAALTALRHNTRRMCRPSISAALAAACPIGPMTAKRTTHDARVAPKRKISFRPRRQAA